jgi:hypothetical protein
MEDGRALSVRGLLRAMKNLEEIGLKFKNLLKREV